MKQLCISALTMMATLLAQAPPEGKHLTNLKKLTDGGQNAEAYWAPDGKRLMVSSKDESRDFEIDIASGKPLWSMTHIQDVAPFQPNGDKAKPLAGFFKAYGTYYVSPQQAQALGLKN